MFQRSLLQAELPMQRSSCRCSPFKSRADARPRPGRARAGPLAHVTGRDNGAVAGAAVGWQRQRPRRQAAPPVRAIPNDERRTVQEMRDVEADPRYRRADYSTLHAYQARHAFLRAIEAGEGALDLAEAALHVAAEDDALVSHSTVQLPVAAYRQRLRRLASDFAVTLRGAGAGASGEAAAVLEALQEFLYGRCGFRVASYGATALPSGATVDHPGVWEKAGHAYLNEVLVSRVGTPAALAIMLADIVRQLLLAGAVDFAVRIDCRDLGRRPRVEALPGVTRAMAVRPDGTVLNTCTSQALVELLRFLKRCYWPYPWAAAGGAHGGFAGAATVFLEGESDAAMQAISRTARHRLERGIWTSPGGGDVRRAIAACERLVLLHGGSCPLERRDLAVLYMHVGRFREAKAELLRFQQTPPPAAARGSQPPALRLSPTGAAVAAGGQPWGEQALVDRLLQLLSGVEPAPEPLSLEAALAEPPPRPQDDAGRLPLTW